MGKVTLKRKLGITVSLALLDEQDTFFLFVNEAIARPYLEVFIFESTDLSPDGNTVKASKIADPVSYQTRKKLHRRRIEMRWGEFDAVFLKKDPPLDASFRRLLKVLARQTTPVINRPAGILTMGTKSYLRHFPQITPKTFYAHDIGNALESIKKLGDCVVKQSDSYGGKGVAHFSYDSGKFYGYEKGEKIAITEKGIEKVIRSYLNASIDVTLLVVEYYQSAGERGDKRVVILEGEKILGSYIRLPNAKTGICECADNGARKCDPAKRDCEILEIIKPHLKKNGIDLAALDLLADGNGVERLSEINVINPGFCNLDVVHPELNIAKQIIDMLERKMR